VTTTLTHLATAASATITVVTEYNSSTVVDNRVHTIIGSALPEYTLKPAQPRTGRFAFLCPSEAAALSLRSLLTSMGSFTLSDSVSTFSDMTFLVTGTISLEVDPQTLRVVIVGVDFSEIV
jgi:hypothetical protein